MGAVVLVLRVLAFAAYMAGVAAFVLFLFAMTA